MAAFAGYRNLADYITRSCKQRDLSERALGEALGRGHNWVNAIKQERYKLTIEAAEQLAAFFDDNPKIVRVLAEIDPIPEEEDEIVAAIREIAISLPKKGRQEFLEYGKFLRQKHGNSS